MKTSALEGGEWSAAPPAALYTRGKIRYPFHRGLGGPQGWSGRAPNGIRSPDRPARSQSVYRLSYPTHILVSIWGKSFCLMDSHDWIVLTLIMFERNTLLVPHNCLMCLVTPQQYGNGPHSSRLCPAYCLREAHSFKCSRIESKILMNLSPLSNHMLLFVRTSLIIVTCKLAPQRIT